tara:strand:+ start:119 stop:526 length:408 start_codon:yes stop_codon:yes gene_type:complete
MKRVLLGLVFLLLSSTEGSNGIRIVPRPLVCPGSYNYTTWTNCLGTFTFASGNKYAGQWENGVSHGQGTFTYVSGSKHIGKYKDGYRNGYGTVTFLNGSKYVGEYRNGKKNGYGVYTWADGETKEGIWKNGRLKK